MITVSMHMNLHSWLNHQYSKIWINLHFFGPKVHFLRLFMALIGKIFNKPPHWYPHILINLRRFICIGMVHGVFYEPVTQWWVIIFWGIYTCFIKGKNVKIWIWNKNLQLAETDQWRDSTKNTSTATMAQPNKLWLSSWLQDSVTSPK